MSEIGETTAMVADLAMEETDRGKAVEMRPRWHEQVALSTLVMAMLAAVGALLAGIAVQEATMERMQEIIDFSILEGDRVEVEILKAKHEILIGLGKTPDQSEMEQIHFFEEEKERLGKEVTLEEAYIQSSMSVHLILAMAVTILSVGITLCGAAIVVDMKYLWIAGLVFGVIGTIGLGAGIFSLAFKR